MLTSHSSNSSNKHSFSQKQRDASDITADRLRVCHFNATSIRGHIEYVRYFLSTQSTFHIIAVTETWLTPSIGSSIIDLPGYALLRRDRDISGGGVALYIHHSLMCEVLCVSSEWTGFPGFPEYIFTSVTPKRGNLIFVAVVYRRPHGRFLDGPTNFFVRHLSQHLHNYSSKIILGDFNANQLLHNDADANFVRDLIREHSLYSVPYGATHHTRTANTWLDLCLVDVCDTVTNYWKTDVPFINGHDLIAAELDILTPRNDLGDTTFSFRDFKSVDTEALSEYLEKCDWSAFTTQGTSLDTILDCLYKNLQLAIENCVPIRTVMQGPSCPKKHPWFTTEHRRLIKERDRLYRRFRRTRFHLDLLDYRLARDTAHESIEAARHSYYFEKLSKLTDPAKIWKELKNLGICPRKECESLDFTVDELNTHFASICFSPTAASVKEYLDTLPTSLPESKFAFSETNIRSIKDAILRSSSQALGTDGIPQSIIRASFSVLGPFLCRLFNQSFREMTFPDRWKKSLVLALNKTTPPKSLHDFRPISLLCFLSKMLERIAHQQISDFLETNALLDVRQSGFRQHHSTQTALIKLTDDIRLGFHQKKLTILLLFDFSKAFDSVCHVTLLKKLRILGFSPDAMKFIASYLVNRSQVVIGENNITSAARPLNRGVPQGSVLGPLLFLIFIDDISSALGVGISHLIFADDLQIYIQGSLDELDNSLLLLGRAAERVKDWTILNHLSLNVTKTKAIVFGTIFYMDLLHKLPPKTLSVGESKLPLETSVRSLGVILDSNLNWKEHVLSVRRKVNSLMYRLNFFRRSTTLNLRKHLVQSLLFPLLDYCSVVFADLSSEQNLILHRAANAGVRYIF